MKTIFQYAKTNFLYGLKSPIPQSGTVAILKLLLPLSVEAFTENLVEKEAVLIMPGSVFDLPGNFLGLDLGEEICLKSFDALRTIWKKRHRKNLRKICFHH